MLAILIVKLHIRDKDIRTKTLAGYEQTRTEKEENLKQLNNIKNDTDRNNGHRKK